MTNWLLFNTIFSEANGGRQARHDESGDTPWPSLLLRVQQNLNTDYRYNTTTKTNHEHVWICTRSARSGLVWSVQIKKDHPWYFFWSARASCITFDAVRLLEKSKSPLLPYKSSANPSNIPIDFLGSLDVPLDPLGLILIILTSYADYHMYHQIALFFCLSRFDHDDLVLS